MDDRTMPFYPVEIELGATAFFVAPGGRATVVFALTNRSGREDYFDISIRGVPAEWLLMDMPVIHLDENERREASLDIQPPVGVDGAYPAVLRAASQSSAETAGEARFDLRVAPAEVGRGDTVLGTASTVAGTTVAVNNGSFASQPASGRVGVFMDMLQFNVVPGGSVALPVVVVNQGIIEDTLFVSIDGIPVSWVSSLAATLRMQPGEQRDVVLYVQPPQAPTSRAGRYPISVRVASQADPTQVMAIDAVLTVAAFSQFTSDISPRRIDAGKSARLRIHNLGNVPGTYTVRWEDRGSLLEYVPSISGPVHIPPGEMAAVDFAVSPRSPNWMGRPVDISYRVLVQSSEGEVQFHNGGVVSRSLIPVWVLPAFLALCATALCLSGLLWNWNQSRLAGVRNTQQAEVALLIMTETASFQQTALGVGLLQTPSIAPILPTPTFPPPTASPQPALPTATGTIIPTLTIEPTWTPSPVPATSTNTPVPPTPTPTLQNTLPPPTATVVQGPPLATATVTAPVPVTGPGQVLFQSNRAGQPDLFLYDPASGTFARMPDGNGPNAQPDWSPDGTRIVFTSARDGNNEIYVMAANGANPVNLTRNPASDSDPRWSADGDSIVFTSDRDGNREIYSMNADGSNPVNLSKSPAEDFRPDWYAQTVLLSTTERILFSTNRDGNNEVYAMNPDGTEPTNLTNNPADDSLPAVRPEGGQVLFVSSRDGNPEIYRMNTDGTSSANLTKNPANDTHPAWSRDGQRVIFVTDRDGNSEVYVMNANGSNPVNLSNNAGQDSDPAW